MTVVELIGNVLLAAAVVCSASFTFLYLSRSRWRSTKPGRALMYLSGVMSTALLWTGFSVFIIARPHDPYELTYGLVRVGIWLAASLVLANMVRTLLRAQRGNRSRRRR